EDFDLGPNCCFVVGEAGERQPQRVIAISADVVQHDGWSIELGDNQIGCAVAVDIGSDNGTGVVKLETIYADGAAYILETLRAAIAPNSQFRSLIGLHNCSEVDPAVVVDIDRSE